MSFTSYSAPAGLLADVAGKARSLLDRRRTQRSKICLFVRKGDHGIGSGFVLTIKRSGLGRIKATGFRIVWVVEPEADVEGVGGREVNCRIETKDLIQQNGLDRNIDVAVTV